MYEENSDKWWQEIVVSRLEEEYKYNSSTAFRTCVEFLRTLITHIDYNGKDENKRFRSYEKVTAYEIFILKLLFIGPDTYFCKR